MKNNEIANNLHSKNYIDLFYFNNFSRSITRSLPPSSIYTVSAQNTWTRDTLAWLLPRSKPQIQAVQIFHQRLATNLKRLRQRSQPTQLEDSLKTVTLERNDVMLSFDVSIFTCISYDLVKKCIPKKMGSNQNSYCCRPRHTFFNAHSFCLLSNYCSFNGRFYTQTDGPLVSDDDQCVETRQ